MLKDEIVKLRRDGYSISDIAKMLGCAKATSSVHSRGIEIKDRSKIEYNIKMARIRSSANASASGKRRWSVLISDVIDAAKREWVTFKKDPEFMGCLGLYWGEGTKKMRRHRTTAVGVANSDPDVLIKCKRFFDRFGSHYYYCNIIIYADQNKTQMKRFWESKLGVEVKHIDVRENIGHRRCEYGTCYLRFSDYTLIHRILTWIECWKAEVP